MITSSGFNLLFRPGLRKDFLDEYNKYAPEWNMFLKGGTTSEVEGAASIFAPINRLVERGEGEPFQWFTPRLGPKVMWTDKEFAAGYQLLKRAVEDDKYGLLKTGSKQLARASQLTKDYRAGGFLDDAFTGTYYKGIDNLSIISSAHTVIGTNGATQSNKLSLVGLSQTAFISAMDLYGQMKDENGDPIKSWPTKLIVGNDANNYAKALQILKSEKEPFTADNQDNITKLRLGKIQPEMSRFLTNPRWYFFIDDSMNDAHLDVRRGLELRDWYDEDISAMKVSASERYVIYHVGWRGWVAANPT